MNYVANANCLDLASRRMVVDFTFAVYRYGHGTT
jgi:hypothetical protein